MNIRIGKDIIYCDNSPLAKCKLLVTINKIKEELEPGKCIIMTVNEHEFRL